MKSWKVLILLWKWIENLNWIKSITFSIFLMEKLCSLGFRVLFQRSSLHLISVLQWYITKMLFNIFPEFSVIPASKLTFRGFDHEIRLMNNKNIIFRWSSFWIFSKWAFVLLVIDFWWEMGFVVLWSVIKCSYFGVVRSN